uniref:Glycosyltransferase RgtA/B/C/D-like domain-containing protein n=1 Tax=Desulfovibrio sp. U5L TaxID=596152 RepID=I2Q413_9BACT
MRPLFEGPGSNRSQPRNHEPCCAMKKRPLFHPFRYPANHLPFEGLRRFLAPPPLALLCILAFGCALRAEQLLWNRSLWLDEAFLALAIVERPLSTLLALPLPYGQTPPPLFLILVKIFSDVAGTSEMALRALPFASACLTLGLWPLLARRHSRAGLLAGAFLLAVSYGGVYYAAEFKPYATEALLSVFFLLAAMRFLEGEPLRHPAGWAALFLLAPWLGFPTVFLLAGLAGGLLAAQGTAPKRLGPAWALLAVGGLSFLAMYGVYARPASATQLRAGYWEAFAAPLPTSLSAFVWYGERASQVLCHFFGLQEPWQGAVLAGLAAIGAMAVLRRDRAYGLVLTLPIAAAVLLSMTGRFPLHERLLIFTLPLCCLLLAEGLVSLGTLFGRVRPALKWLPAAAVLALLVRPTAAAVFDPGTFERQEFRKIGQQILQARADGDAVFVFQAAVPLLEYYGRQDPRLTGFTPLSVTRGDPSSLDEAVRTVKAAGHGWVLFAHVRQREERLLEAAFEDGGAVRQRLAAKGVWAFAFDVKRP